MNNLSDLPQYSEKKMEQELERGRQGLIRSIRRAIKQQFGDAPAELMDKLAALPSVPLESLAEKVFHFKSLADVEKFVAEVETKS